MHLKCIGVCQRAVNTLSMEWLLIMNWEEYLIGILVRINNQIILKISQDCGHYLRLSICHESAYFMPQSEKKKKNRKYRLILDFIRPFHINRRSNDQSCGTRQSFLKPDSFDKGVGSDLFHSPAKRRRAAPACPAPDGSSSCNRKSSTSSFWAAACWIMKWVSSGT